jgi:hypothetical protein
MAHAVQLWTCTFMNQVFHPSSFGMPVAGRVVVRAARRAGRSAWSKHEEAARLRRLRSLLALFALYATALLFVVVVSEGADIGCILGGIAGHVLYATHRVAGCWRDAASLEDAKARVGPLFRPRLA